MASVGKHIKQLRAAKRLTQEQLAEKLFVTRQAVSAWETGKALPDVETLERIAAALDAETAEVIYGAPRSPDLRGVKRRWAVIGGAVVLLLAALFFTLYKNGAIGTWKYGLRYQFYNQNYSVTQKRHMGGPYSVELDLSAPESNVGKVLYEDETGCRIIVASLEPNPDGLGEYQLVFQAQGSYDRSGGQLISGCYDKQTDKNGYQVELSASARTTVGGKRLSLSHDYLQTSLGKDGNKFGFYIFPTDVYGEDGFTLTEELAAAGNRVTVTVTGLTSTTTRYRSSIFG